MPDPLPQDQAAQDLALVQAIRTGDAGAWSTLLARYQDRLFAVCLRTLGRTGPGARDTAADLCQDAMVKIIQGLHTFDSSAQLSTWMIRVTMNVCLSHLRAQKLRRHASLDAPTGPSATQTSTPSNLGSTLASREPGSLESVQHHEAREQVAIALAALDSEQRAILVLRDVRGLDYDQIAQVLGVATGTVKSRLFRARAALRERLESMSKPSS